MGPSKPSRKACNQQRQPRNLMRKFAWTARAGVACDQNVLDSGLGRRTIAEQHASRSSHRTSCTGDDLLNASSLSEIVTREVFAIADGRCVRDKGTSFCFSRPQETDSGIKHSNELEQSGQAPLLRIKWTKGLHRPKTQAVKLVGELAARTLRSADCGRHGGCANTEQLTVAIQNWH
ncbi:hypothetical protein BV20DRAFT_49610 [Pilatotrama ljubarskyi]|nr:hypothetical protein BV20DRAFT_49610 [Pilatotrama ljubarskyi]